MDTRHYSICRGLPHLLISMTLFPRPFLPKPTHFHPRSALYPNIDHDAREQRNPMIINIRLRPNQTRNPIFKLSIMARDTIYHATPCINFPISSHGLSCITTLLQ
ncbi:hypothetical protein QCA50_014483 [Cerrena zonata]|uniref:Uncharacterized protein n=1 Tax=Cerrena zonata TaxID=2478898 RepID=A0AAW0FTV3_9APHY